MYSNDLNEKKTTFDKICYVVYRGKSGTFFFFLNGVGIPPLCFYVGLHAVANHVFRDNFLRYIVKLCVYCL